MSAGIARLQVIVEEIIPSRGSAMCKEVSGGKHLEVGLLPMRTGRLPEVGERWLLDREYQAWTFAALLATTHLFSTKVGATAPLNPKVGDRWVPTPAKVWNGTAWVDE